jgi:hypothetical protein
LGLGLVQPFPRYRVYDVEYPQFVCAGCFLEVGEELLDENGFVLCDGDEVSKNVGCTAFDMGMLLLMLLTWTLATHSAVIFVMREPDTPGGFSESMPCRPASRSATTDADDAMVYWWWAMADQEM